MVEGWNGPLEKVDRFRYQIPRTYKREMRTDGLIFIDEPLLPLLRQNRAPEQVANAATMPGIVCQPMARPALRWGDGSPIGARAAFHDGSYGATTRGNDQVGSLGAGNHSLEIQKVDRVYDERAAKALGLESVGSVAIMVHTGSRGFGHQIATDYIDVCERVVKREKIELPDLQLACAPIGSKEGQDYWKAMCCGANFAWNNRQLITFGVRNAFADVLGRPADALGMGIVYDVCHNIGKVEEHVA